MDPHMFCDVGKSKTFNENIGVFLFLLNLELTLWCFFNFNYFDMYSYELEKLRCDIYSDLEPEFYSFS